MGHFTKVATSTVAAAALAAVVGFGMVDEARADIAGLTPCSESKQYAKKQKKAISALTRRLEKACLQKGCYCTEDRQIAVMCLYSMSKTALQLSLCKPPSIKRIRDLSSTPKTVSSVERTVCHISLPIQDTLSNTVTLAKFS